MKIFYKKTRLFVFAFLLVFISCKNKINTNTATDIEANDNTNSNYDWTGTYELKDNDLLYTLKLHKRSVDGSYEMQFYNNSNQAVLYKSSVYDAKDKANSISIRFLNNFNMDVSSLGFKSGDTLFILQHLNDKTDSAIFKSFIPETKNSSWNKVSSGYN
jgi:hypothetical protein